MIKLKMHEEALACAVVTLRHEAEGVAGRLAALADGAPFPPGLSYLASLLLAWAELANASRTGDEITLFGERVCAEDFDTAWLSDLRHAAALQWVECWDARATARIAAARGEA